MRDVVAITYGVGGDIKPVSGSLKEDRIVVEWHGAENSVVLTLSYYNKVKVYLEFQPGDDDEPTYFTDCTVNIPHTINAIRKFLGIQ